jgi:hypothetical protein
MENESKKDEQINPYKKNKDIVISISLLKKIVIGLLALICIFLVVTYLNSGLTHKKAKEVFLEKYWDREDKVFDFNVDGVKQIKKDTYWVKVRYRLWENEWVDKNGVVKLKNHEKKVFVDGYLDYRDYLIEKDGLKEKYNYHEYQKDLLYIKWDTGWFIEEKKK